MWKTSELISNQQIVTWRGVESLIEVHRQSSNVIGWLHRRPGQMAPVSVMKTIVKMSSMRRKPSKLTVEWSNSRTVAKSSAKFAGAVNRLATTRSLTRASVTALSVSFTTSALSSGWSRKWQLRRSQTKSATCGSNSSARFARRHTLTFLNPMAIVSAW